MRTHPLKHLSNFPACFMPATHICELYFQFSELSSQSKFEEIQRSNRAAAQRFTESHYSSSSDDEDGGDVELNGKRGKILDSTFTSYTDQTGDEDIKVALKRSLCCLIVNIFTFLLYHMLS